METHSASVAAEIYWYHALKYTQKELLTDSKLTFENHVNKLCKKASQKPNALARISNYMTFDKRMIIMKAFIASQFSYCSLVWMFHRKRLDQKINALTGEDFKNQSSHLMKCWKKITLFQSIIKTC